MMDDATENEDGLEKEGVSDDPQFPEDINDPFDPAEIKVSKRVTPINLIVNRIGHGEIDLAPEFQRKARIWDQTRKSRLIESILLRIPLPVFYVASDEEENWRVVDGLQRLTTIYDFVAGEEKHRFKLKGLEYLTPFECAQYEELPRSIKRRIDETELNVNVIEYGTPETVMFNIFSRLNTGGMILNSQEIRNALHPGPVRAFLLDLIRNENFMLATGGGVSDNRMGARELALRFCAFQMTQFEKYHASDLDGFLNDAMRQINRMSKTDRENLSDSFNKAMRRSFEIFGDDAFRKRARNQTRRSPVNRALFETTSVNLSALSNNNFEYITKNLEEFEDIYLELFYDDDFSRSISLSTGSKYSIYTRFQKFSQLLKDFVL